MVCFVLVCFGVHLTLRPLSREIEGKSVFNPLSQEGGRWGVVATPPFGFSLVPFLRFC